MAEASDLTVFTVADESYIPGLVGLVESLRAYGFDGRICVGAMDDTVSNLSGDGLSSYRLEVDDGVFPGNLKPDLILAQDCKKFLWLDADIVISNSGFMAGVNEWVERAPVFAAEALVAPTDYRRHVWQELGMDRPRDEKMVYFNSGMFAGVMSRDRPLLKRWQRLNQTVIDLGDRHFTAEAFPLADQDTLNTVLQGRSNEEIISIQPPDWWNAAAPTNSFFHVGGFPNEPAFLHCTTGEKPWLLENVPARAPNRYESAWFEFIRRESASISHRVSLARSIEWWLEERWTSRLSVKLRRLGSRLLP